MNWKTISIIFFIMFCTLTKGQEYRWGLSGSITKIMSTDKWKVSYYSPPPYREVQYEREMDYWGYGLYYCGVWQLGTKNEILIKPGIFLSNETFSGIECGFYYKRILFDDFKAGLGLNVNIHDFFEWANGRPVNTTIDLSIERRIINDIFLGVTFSKPVNENFGNSYQSRINGEIINGGYAVSNVHYMLKAYIEYYP